MFSSVWSAREFSPLLFSFSNSHAIECINVISAFFMCVFRDKATCFSYRIHGLCWRQQKKGKVFSFFSARLLGRATSPSQNRVDSSSLGLGSVPTWLSEGERRAPWRDANKASRASGHQTAGERLPSESARPKSPTFILHTYPTQHIVR